MKDQIKFIREEDLSILIHTGGNASRYINN